MGFGGSWGWDEGGKGKGDGEGDGAEGEDDGTGFLAKRDAVDEEEGARRKEEEEAADERGYTMDMMLKSLNVKLGVIGFDATSQKWVG